MSEYELFRNALSSRAARVEAHLDQVLVTAPLVQEIARPDRLVAAMRHAVLNGGKRLRPFLVLEVAALLGARDEDAIGAAVANSRSP